MNELDAAKLIETYLEGGLDETQVALLEAKAKEDPLFAAEILLRKDIETANNEIDVIQLEDKLKEIGNKEWANPKNRQQKAKVVSIFKRYRAFAAVLAVLIVCAVVLFLKDQSSKDLFATFYQPYPMYLTTRSLNVSDENLNQAILAYEHGNYEAAWSSFLNILADDPTNMDIMFYTSMSALQLNRFADAEAGLKKVADQGINIYATPAEWYLGLVRIKSGDIKNARRVFESIVEKESDYSDDAKSVLRLMDGAK